MGGKIRAMENTLAVQNQVLQLNLLNPSESWIPVDGFNFMNAVKINPNNTITLEKSKGYPVKLFLNTATGEVKVFNASRFKI